MKNALKYLGFYMVWIFQLAVISMQFLRIYVPALEPLKNVLYVGAVLIILIQLVQWIFEKKIPALDFKTVKMEQPVLYRMYQNSFKVLCLLMLIVSVMDIQVSNS